MPVTKTPSFIFSNATQRDAHTAADGVIIGDTCVVEEDLSTHIFNGSVWVPDRPYIVAGPPIAADFTAFHNQILPVSANGMGALAFTINAPTTPKNGSQWGLADFTNIAAGDTYTVGGNGEAIENPFSGAIGATFVVPGLSAILDKPVMWQYWLAGAPFTPFWKIISTSA